MLKDTGERVIPEKLDIFNELLIEHLARYQFATRYAHGRVLDFACGTGYGSHMIAKKCKKRVKEVIGIDREQDAIYYAESNYYHPLTTFQVGDVTDRNLPDELGTFDCIVSFETYEHIEKEINFLDNLNRLLAPGGTLVLSTPFGKGRGIPSATPFHVHQITEEEFKQLFVEFPYEVEYFYQHGALIVPECGIDEQYFPIGIAVCRKST